MHAVSLLFIGIYALFFVPKIAAQSVSTPVPDNILSPADSNKWGNFGMHRLSDWRFSPQPPAVIRDGISLAGGDSVSLRHMYDVRKRNDWNGYAWFENQFEVDSALANRGWMMNYFSPAAVRIWLNGRLVLQSGNPSVSPNEEVLGRFLFAEQTSVAFRPGKNTFLIEFSEQTLNPLWGENRVNVPMNIVDLYVVKPRFGNQARLRTFVFGGAMMLLITLVLMHGFLAFRFRSDYHKFVALTTFFMLLHAFTTLSDTLIVWSWAYGGFHAWVSAFAFMFVMYFYLISIRRIYKLPVPWRSLTAVLIVSLLIGLYALYFQFELFDFLHPVLAISSLAYGIFSLWEAKKSDRSVEIGVVTTGLIVTIGGAIGYVLVYIVLGFTNDFVFIGSILMAFSGIPMSLTYNIARNYAGLIASLEQKVKERTAALQASKAELEKADEYKSRFFANISHEFRTPLTIARGLVDRISQKNLNDETVKSDLIPVKRNLKRLGDMVNQIVDLTKADHNQMTLHPKNYYGDAVVSIDVESFRSLAEYRKQELTYRPGARDAIVYVDRPKMEIMVNNLISNAIKYTPEFGRIVVETRVSDGFYQVFVEDNGKGIPPHEQDAIFERFHRIKQNAEDYVEGMGIGLELSRSLARLHGGEISLDKERAIGSRFCLSLPLSKVNEPVQTDESYMEAEEFEEIPAEQKPRSFSILLAEDNDDMANYVSGVLSDVGTVTRAANGKIALEKLASTTFDLVITDLMMPVMDGTELVKTMQRTEAFRKIPTMVLSARALEQDKLELLRIGVVDYITKPFLVDELLLKTRNLLHLSENRQKAEIHLTPAEKQLETDTIAPKAAAFVQEHIKNGSLSIDMVADHFGISRRTFYRIIEAETGMTSAEFIREVRLQTARNLSQNGTEWTLDSLAAEVGYASGKNFKKLFMERFGTKPV